MCDDGKAYSWGDPYKGQLGTLPKGTEWTHQIKHLESSPKPIKLPEGVIPKKVVAGGIHQAILSTDGQLFTHGCGSDGRLGHPEYEGHVFLYKESQPKKIETITTPVIDVASAYYHMICIA